MTDPLSQVIELLAPRAVFAKGISGAGRWSVRYRAFGQPGFCAVTEGTCRLAVDGEAPVLLEEGDFVLLPATPAFTMSSLEAGPVVDIDPEVASRASVEVRHGRQDGPPELRQFGGYFSFGSPDAALIVSLLPRMIHIRDRPHLAQLVRLVGREAAADNAGREFVLARLVDILLVEALRSTPSGTAQAGLLRGLADARISVALRCMHADVQRVWTIPELAREAGMSRSAFFDRFVRMVGIRPMEYLLSWRMALAKHLLRAGQLSLDEVARQIGYGSASTFSTAFSRHAGLPPGRFSRMGPEDAFAL